MGARKQGANKNLSKEKIHPLKGRGELLITVKWSPSTGNSSADISQPAEEVITDLHYTRGGALTINRAFWFVAPLYHHE